MQRFKEDGEKAGKTRNRKWAKTIGKVAFAVSLALICLMTGRDTRGSGTGQVLTSKSIPEATIALIDPESGTSIGGGSTDVNIAVGDIISFRIHFSSIPDGDLRGIQGYLTEYIPKNTEVVGVRILDSDGNTLMPRPPGLARDGCGRPCTTHNNLPCDNSVSGCTDGTRTLQSGSHSQVHGDTGFFFAVDDRLDRYPFDRFLTTKNGILMSPVPRNIGRISAIINVSSPFYAHNEWDWTQVQAYGYSKCADGSDGRGSNPYMYASPVAGPETFYAYEATKVAPGVIQFNDEIGPWERIFYPGSRIGFGNPVTSAGTAARTSELTTLGWDVTPNNPLPVTAIRAAVGAVHPGEPGIFEIALRVKALPLDPDQGQDVNCGEVFSSEVAGDTQQDPTWSYYLPSPGCVYLNLKFDLDVDKDLAVGGELLTYTIDGKNLSTNDQHNVVVKQKYDSTTVSFVNADGGGYQAANCDGDGFDCIIWELGDLAPADEYTFYTSFTVGGTGQRLVPMIGVYESNELPAPGYRTNAVTIIRAAPVIKVDMENPQTGTTQGGTAYVNGLFTNDGSGGSTWNTLFFLLPENWTIVPGSVRLGGTVLSCANTGTSTPSCTMNRTFSIAQTEEITFELNVPAGIPTGLYDIDFRITNSTQAFGAFETYFPMAVTIPVGANRSDPPVLTCPIEAGDTTISGTTNGPDGTHIRVYFNAIERDEEPNAVGGVWEVSDFPTTFGEFYGGIEVRVTAQAPGELESEISNTCETGGWSGLPQCSDGIDNDGDGLTDFPYDPGCESPWDNSEEDRPPYDYTGIDLPVCWDGIDHDGDGFTDFPDDPGCISWFDDSEEPLDYIDDQLKARLLIVFDTSGSMNWNLCEDVFTGGDGSEECPGFDIPCAVCDAEGCDDGLPNDSRMYIAKEGLRMAVSAYGNVEWALMRFHQRAEEFICPGEYASLRGGGWQGAGAAPCVGDFDGGDLLVRFAPQNAWHILQWMNHSSNYPGGDPPPGLDWELRGSGTTPLAGSLNSAYEYLVGVKTEDAKVECREYRVILVTDGEETCGGDPVTAASDLFGQGLPVHVIGFATHHESMIDNLNAIAQAGGTGSAAFANDSASLSAAIAQIVADSFVVELCNDIDDDCNGLTDETFPLKGQPCDNGLLGICRGTGYYVCTADGLGVECMITDPGEEPREEECNGLDDDCDGIIDNVDPEQYPYGCNPPPDLCDPLYPENEGLDDPRVGQICGSDVGECATGITECENGQIVCVGEIGPEPEVCDGRDNNCNGLTDEGLSRPCYISREGYPEGCVYDEGTDTWDCVGECSTGIQVCDVGEWGPCMGYVNERDEVCDGRDNNCNGLTDEDLTQYCQITNEWGTCTGFETCEEGAWVDCDAQTPEEEVCDGVDNNCDGITDMVTQSCYDYATGCTFNDATQTWDCVGLCRAGTRLCTEGAFGECTGARGPTDELCNGLDDNCDGTIDKDEFGNPLTQTCYTGPAGTEGVGECKAGVRTCLGGMWSGCEGEVTPQPEVCDGRDNNCNGLIDDGLGQTTCGLGECEKTIDNCVDGEPQVCDPFEGATPEVCDGRDNNCDGITDGLIEPCYTFEEGCVFDTDTETWTCEGMCTTGIRRCPTPEQGGTGEWGPCEFQQGPQPEVCDGRDNNCNGLTDEDLERPCQVTNEWGTCTGVETCDIGAWVGCDAQIPAEEVCDGIDNNCDGITDMVTRGCYDLGDGCTFDEGTQTWSCVGECRLGTQLCVDAEYGECTGAQGPTDEVCDGLDNNCDGQIDKDEFGNPLTQVCYTGPPETEGVGECKSGVRSCTNGVWGACVGEVTPQQEVCDGLDNDCNGLTDDGLGQTTCGLGECEKTIDNCVDGIPQVCDPFEGATPEVCDGRDNNCDGITDGLIEVCYTYDTGCVFDDVTQTWDCEGICATGIRRCPTPEQGGTGVWGPCEFQQGPQDEVCDGRDNNCNGLTDEDEHGNPLSQACYPPGSGPDTGCELNPDTNEWECLGICQAGERLCIDGAWDPCTGYVTPQAEICNNLDDNCDGQTDEPENLVGLGQPCGSAIGRCTQGIMECIDGQEVCVGGEGPFPGDCNGMDDNCDGVIDDPDEVGHLEGLPCGTDVGECEFGETKCVGGEIICVGGKEPTEEICNGLDDNCNGLIDDGAVCPPGSYCYDGACRPVCDPGDEFSCPPQTDCVEVFIDSVQDYRHICLPTVGDCGGETCPEGWICVDDVCVDPCEGVECEPWEECRQGICMDQSCTAFGIDCPPDQLCVNHECVDDPCIGANCDENTEFCFRECDETGCSHECRKVCTCPPGERCTPDADCIEDLCHEVSCTGATRCNPETGECEPDPCFGITCSSDEVCYEGECIEDPCKYADCPPGYNCALVDTGGSTPSAQCRADHRFWDPGAGTVDVFATGKGGCSCRTSGGDSRPSGPFGLILLLLLSIIVRGSAKNRGDKERRMGQ